MFEATALLATYRRHEHVTDAADGLDHRLAVFARFDFATQATDLHVDHAVKTRGHAVLGAIKTEFGKFGEVLEATHRKLEQASRSIESAGVRTRQIERKLKSVEALPVIEAQLRLGDLEDLAAATGEA